MKIFADKTIKHFFFAVTCISACFLILSQLAVWFFYRELSLLFLILSLLSAGSILTVCFLYFFRQNKIMEDAVLQMNAYLDGDTTARIDCDEEGELYRLFHSVNTLAAVLNAHASNELKEKQFLKDTISDISHQLKTPLAALNIYNGLLLDESEELPAVREFAELSEQELDRIETLVQNLLKITKLDAGTIVIEKNMENVADMMKDVELHFAYRARQEQKELVLSGPDDVIFLCDRDWLIEAIDNIVKNALDYTEPGGLIHVEWKQFMSVVQIVIKDNGKGIHPEDLHYIFKRFYRSHFSKDTKGIGLGLSLAKAIIEEHNGTIKVSSCPGAGTVFVINILNSIKL